MGLFTGNVERFRKPLYKLSQKSLKLGFLIYFVGLAVLFYLPQNKSNSYISENALTPMASHLSRINRNKITRFSKLFAKEVCPDSKSGFCHSFLTKKLEDIGLETYQQSFEWKEENKANNFEGHNVYGILRSGRSDGAESIVIVIAYEKGMDFKNETNHLTLGLAYELFKFLVSQNYWARDIILLVTEGGNAGVQAWTDGYHYTKQSSSDYGLSYSPIYGHAGSLQGGIVISSNHMFISGVDVYFAGVNGQLPNLDLFNIIVNIIQSFNLKIFINKPVSFLRSFFKTKLKENYPVELDLPLRSVDKTINMMYKQAMSLPDGAHGLFFKYNIHIVTLKTRKGDPQFGSDVVHFGRIVEDIIRRLNSLMERFHQSFFFYLLPTTKNYISIGDFLIPSGIILAPLLLMAIGLWVQSGDWNEEEIVKEKTKEKNELVNPKKEKEEGEKNKTGENDAKKSENDTKKDDNDAKKGENDAKKDSDNNEHNRIETIETITEEEFEIPYSGLAFSQKERNLATPLFLVLLSSLVSATLTWSSFKILECYGQEIFITAYPVSIVCALVVIGIGYFWSSSNQEGCAENWILLKCITLTYSGALLASIILINFSLGTFLAILIVPSLLIVRPIRYKTSENEVKISFFGISFFIPLFSCFAPPISFYLFSALKTIYGNFQNNDILTLLAEYDQKAVLKTYEQLVLNYFEGYNLMGVFLLPFISFLFWTLYFLCFIILFSKV